MRVDLPLDLHVDFGYSSQVQGSSRAGKLSHPNASHSTANAHYWQWQS
jgi:hypothetical protein